MSADTDVTYERVGATAVLTIDRPERRNAVDGPTAVKLKEGYERFVADDGARVLILTGGGDVSFCAGADLKAIETFGPRQLDPAGPLGFTRLASPKPTIAAIEGFCLAGGLELALWCDLRIAGDTARLGFPERRWGVPLVDGGTQRLPRIVGMGRALDLVLTGRIIDHVEAHAMGLLTEVVPKGNARERAIAFGEALAAFPQDTMLADRAATLEAPGLPLQYGLAVEGAGGPGVFATAIEGAGRFASGAGRGGAGAGV